MSSMDDETQLVDNDQLRLSTKPHLVFEHETDDVTAPEYVNPALEDEMFHSSEGTANGVSAGNSVTSNGRTLTSDAKAETEATDAQTRPVHYSNRAGETVVIQEPIVITRADGRTVIQTQQCCHLAPHRHHRERPLRVRHIKFLKAFSFVALVVFFPLGIPAVYFAFKTHKEFDSGAQRGDLDLARKLARKTEKFIIFSILGALLVAVAVFAIVERQMMTEDEYWQSRSSAILPAG